MTDADAMHRCSELADQARAVGEAPVGCVITRNGLLVAQARESVQSLCDPTAHAEILAVRAACDAQQRLNLRGCVLYTNVEPCHMCAYAIREARLDRVVFLRRVGPIGGTRSTEPLLLKASEEWGDAPVVEIREEGGAVCHHPRRRREEPLDTELQELLAREAVIAVVNRLFISTDERDWQAVQSCFAPEVLFDMTSVAGGEPAVQTPEQIAAGWEQGLKDLEAIHHQVGNYRVHIQGSQAEAFCYGIASHYLPNKTGNNTRTFVGSYNFHLISVGGTWKMDQFRFNLKYIEGNKDLEASR